MIKLKVITESNTMLVTLDSADMYDPSEPVVSGEQTIVIPWDEMCDHEGRFATDWGITPQSYIEIVEKCGYVCEVVDG